MLALRFPVILFIVWSPDGVITLLRTILRSKREIVSIALEKNYRSPFNIQSHSQKP